MTQQYRSEKFSKATARIDPALYDRVRPYFPYGHQTLLFQSIFEAIDKKIQDGDFGQVLDFLFKRSSLTLDIVEKTKVEK